MKYRVSHVTTYRYAESVANSQHDLHLLPRDLEHQQCHSAILEISPLPSVCQERVDYFGNRAAHVVLATSHTEFSVKAKSLITVTPAPGFEPETDVAWEEAGSTIAKQKVPLHVIEMTFPSPYVVPWKDLRDYAAPSFSPKRPLLAGCLDLMARIHTDFVYDPQATTIATPLRDVFLMRRGICQDFSHLMIGCLRALKLSARYVSGYLVTNPPLGQPRLVGVDASHAWLSVYSPRFGFVDLDPTNNSIVRDAHLTLAIGRDFGDVTPLRGVILGGGRHDVHVGVDVLPEI